MRLRITSFAVSLLALTVLFWTELERLISFSLGVGYSSHIVAAPVITAYLLWILRDKIFIKPASSILPAACVATAALVVFSFARHYRQGLGENDTLSLIAFSYCLWVFAIFFACFGSRAFKSAIFPLAMLLFFVPLPEQLAHRTVVALQSGSASLVYGIFSLLRVPVLRDGLVFTVPGVSIEIAEECSGINSSIALLISTILIAHECLRLPSSRILFVLASLPLAIVKNAIRIVTLTLLATHVDMGFLTGNLHRRGGFGFFVLALALMFPIWRVLLKWERSVLAKRTAPASTLEAAFLPPSREPVGD